MARHSGLARQTSRAMRGAQIRSIPLRSNIAAARTAGKVSTGARSAGGAYFRALGDPGIKGMAAAYVGGAAIGLTSYGVAYGATQAARGVTKGVHALSSHHAAVVKERSSAQRKAASVQSRAARTAAGHTGGHGRPGGNPNHGEHGHFA